MPRALLLALVCAATPAYAENRTDARLRATIDTLANDIGPRPRNSAAAARAADWIEKRAIAAGLTVERLAVGTVVSPAITVLGKPIMRRQTHHVRDDNLVARIAGAEPGPAILVMAHYDSVPGTPGAVDNATGVALLLELGRELAIGPPPSRPIILAWTASEEYGLAGARALARELGSQVGLAIALDLIGAAGDLNLNGLGPLIGRDWLRWLAEVARDAEIDLQAPVSHRVVSRHVPQIERSDHGAFAELGIPAFHLYSRGPERIYLDYHMPGDVPARVSMAALHRANALLLAVARKPGPLPRAGGGPGMWLPLPGGPRVISSPVLGLLQLGLALVGLSGLVALRRRRSSPHRGFGFGLLGFVVVCAAGWGVTTLIFSGAIRYHDHVAPWVHAPLRFSSLAIAVATAAIVGFAHLARRSMPAVGCGRFLAAAILTVATAAAGCVLVDAAELALVPLMSAACLGAAAWCRRPYTAAPWLALSLLPLPFALDPAFLREAVFHGFVPATAPLWPITGLILAPYTLAGMYFWRRFGPEDRQRTAIVLPIAAAIAVAGTLGAILPPPACTGAQFARDSLYCERYGD